MNPGSVHLELEELLSDINGEAVSERARAHLATCGSCRAEARRWQTIAGGVRGLVAATPEAARPPLPRRTGLAALTGPGRRAMLAASAAAALLLAGGGYGLTVAFTGHATGPAGAGTTTAALTAVNGCAGLVQASGTLAQVTGTSLVITTASGQPVTVTTSPSTMVSESGAPLSDITDGASVIVAGPESGGTIAAQHVQIVAAVQRGIPETPPGIVAVHGTVADASTGGFTVVTSTGTRVPVTTSSETEVGLFDPSLSQLQTGANTIAVGHASPAGTLTAIAVLQPPPGWHGKLQVEGCSPASIDNAITTALVSSG
jgi:hypothetical protein